MVPEDLTMIFTMDTELLQKARIRHLAKWPRMHGRQLTDVLKKLVQAVAVHQHLSDSSIQAL